MSNKTSINTPILTEEQKKNISNGIWSGISPETLRGMRMAFDKDREGQLYQLIHGDPFFISLVCGDDENFSKPDRASRVYMLQEHKGTAGIMCALYGISQAYYRTLRQIKRTEWIEQQAENEELMYKFMYEMGIKHKDKPDNLIKLGYCILWCDLNVYKLTKEILKEIYELTEETWDKQQPDIKASSSLT